MANIDTGENSHIYRTANYTANILQIILQAVNSRHGNSLGLGRRLHDGI